MKHSLPLSKISLTGVAVVVVVVLTVEGEGISANNKIFSENHKISTVFPMEFEF